MSGQPNDLVDEFYASRVIVAGMDIARADVDGCDPLVREDLHEEMELVVHDAVEAGLTHIYSDAVRILESLADLGSRIQYLG